MPCTPIRLPSLFACLLVFAGCATDPIDIAPRDPVSARAEISRLKALGFKAAGRAKDGTRVFSYSGPVTRAVMCRSGDNPAEQISPTRTSADGSIVEVTLDAYLQLSPGKDGILSAGERSGIYAVTIINRSKDRSRIVGLERITFEPDGRGKVSSRSNLLCPAA